MRPALPDANVFPFPVRVERNQVALQVNFERAELMRILDLYGRMVAAGEWRDYAMDFTRDFAAFAAFRRTADVPQMRLEKRPAPAKACGPCSASTAKCSSAGTSWRACWRRWSGDC